MDNSKYRDLWDSLVSANFRSQLPLNWNFFFFDWCSLSMLWKIEYFPLAYKISKRLILFWFVSFIYFNQSSSMSERYTQKINNLLLIQMHQVNACYDLVTCSIAPGLTLSEKDKQKVSSYLSHLSRLKTCAVAGLWPFVLVIKSIIKKCGKTLCHHVYFQAHFTHL